MMNNSPNASPALSPRKTRIVVFVGDYIDRNGWAPTYPEIGDAVGLRSRSAVHHHVHRLVEAGYLTRGVPGSRVTTVPTAAGWRLCAAVAASVSRHPAARRTA